MAWKVVVEINDLDYKEAKRIEALLESIIIGGNHHEDTSVISVIEQNEQEMEAEIHRTILQIEAQDQAELLAKMEHFDARSELPAPGAGNRETRKPDSLVESAITMLQETGNQEEDTDG